MCYPLSFLFTTVYCSSFIDCYLLFSLLSHPLSLFSLVCRRKERIAQFGTRTPGASDAGNIPHTDAGIQSQGVPEVCPHLMFQTTFTPPESFFQMCYRDFTIRIISAKHMSGAEMEKMSQTLAAGLDDSLRKQLDSALG